MDSYQWERASRSFGQHREPRARPPGFDPRAQRISAQKLVGMGKLPGSKKWILINSSDN